MEAMIKSLANKLIQQQQQQQAANSSASGPDSAVRPRANGIVFDEFISVCVKLQVINKKKIIAVLGYPRPNKQIYISFFLLL